MSPRLTHQRRLLLIGLLIIGIIIGTVFITPRVGNDKVLGGLTGFISSLVVSFFLFPELRVIFDGVWNGNNYAGITLKNYFSHPTQKPLMLGILWFIVFVILSLSGIDNLILDNFQAKDKPYLLFIFLSPTLFLLGYSGFLMIKFKEGVNKLGQVYRGNSVYFNGILGILCGWGILIFMFLIYIFKW